MIWKLIALAAVSGLYCGDTNAAQPVSPFSSYGQIQNVQNYSSNPFWDPNGPYNQKFPSPVYAQGTDLNTGECQSVVAALIAAHCASHNNCTGLRLADVRPTIMVQLSRMPGHNYASSCAGYIDAAFDAYVSQNSYVAPSAGAMFPTGTVPNPNANAEPYKMKNPYAMQLPSAPGDPWAQNMVNRVVEMKQLQAQNGANTPKIGATGFESTAADLTFAERMENAKAGYEPFKDKTMYHKLTIESDKEAAQRRQITNANGNGGGKANNTNTNTNNTNKNQKPLSDRQRIVDTIMNAFKGNE